MPWKERTVEKMYWSIGEVADQLGVNTSLIRYWEKEFASLRPKRTGKGDRMYTKKEIEQLQQIQHLVKEKGFTLQGAKDQLRSGEAPQPTPTVDIDQLREKLTGLRSKLLALAKEPAEEV